MKIPFWRTFGAALLAPFTLGLAAWRALVIPLLVFAGASVLAFMASEGHLGELAWAPAALLGLVGTAWLALGFQRQLLLGTAARHAGHGFWRRYGLYVLATASIGLLLGILASLLLALALPATAWFLTAINSPNPWLAAGAVLLGVLAYGVAAYLPARLALVLPALAVDHAAGPAPIWRLSRGNGLRLLTLLVLIPGSLHGLLELSLPRGGSALAVNIAGGLLGSYLLLMELAMLALAYRALNGEGLPAVSPESTGPRPVLSPRFMWALVLIVLVGAGGVALWDSVYRVEPGTATLISRQGKLDRIDVEPGVKLKIPLLDKTRSVPEVTEHHRQGEGRFLTIDKGRLSLRYRIDWRVTDAQRYARTVAGDAARTNQWIDEVAVGLLRRRVARLSSADIRRLVDAGGAERSIHAERGPDALLGDVLEKGNDRIRDLGVEITTWRVEVEGQPAS